MSAEATQPGSVPFLSTSRQLRHRQIRGQVMRLLVPGRNVRRHPRARRASLDRVGSRCAVAELAPDHQHAVAQAGAEAGLNSALWGTIWVISLTAIIAFPIGVGAAIFLEEYAPRTRWTKALQVNISNLAGVPSVVYGLLGLGVFVQFMNLGRVVLAGALTMALLSLPVIIISSQEAIRAVPLSFARRHTASARHAGRWSGTMSCRRRFPES